MLSFSSQRLLYDALLRYEDAAFEHLYKLIYARVSQHVRQSGGTPEQTRELVHETIIAFLFNLKNGQYEWRAEAELTTYATAIAHNIWRHQQRKNEQKQTIPVVENDLVETFAEPDEELSFEDRRQAVEQALGQLGEKCRQAIQLYYWEKLPMQQIARRLGWANEAVARKEKSRCLKNLRDKLTN